MNGLLSFLSGIRWQDIVDVLLNSYILFRLYVLFRGTNVIRVIGGIALLWVFQRVAVAMGLIVTSWAMQGIIAGAALIIVIVFRNEIRNVLQTKNLKALLWGFAQKSERTPIDSLVESTYELARNRIGALIVLPGREDLDEMVQGGVAWGGRVSKEMMLSVFWNGNPVHDGAAVIEGGQVTRVGCILPLSSREDLPHYFGTRHRAAVGLAEQSDALVLAVSEERGEVVAAKNGAILPIEDNLALLRLLHAHLRAPTENSLSARKERTRLIAAAVVCVACMAVVWFSFAKGMETLISIEVPLEYMGRDTRMQVVSSSVNAVRLQLSGSGTLISSMRPDQVKVKLDLSHAKNGENTFAISRESIIVPPGVRLNRIEPSEVTVKLDLPVPKELPVQVDWIGALPKGLIMESATVIPENVTVIGTEHYLQQITTLYTRRISLDKLNASGQITIGLAFDPSVMKIGDGSVSEVVVRYKIRTRETAPSS